MKRRKFIQISSTGSLAGFMLNGHLVNAFTRTKLLNNVSEDVIRDRSMVMIQLSGGNDGLNSVIPKNQYDKYASIRPTIRIKESGNNAGIELDTTLGVENQTLLHPNLLDPYPRQDFHVLHHRMDKTVRYNHLQANHVLLCIVPNSCRILFSY